MAKRKQKKEAVKGVDARINNNDAELHQTEQAADDRTRIREQAGHNAPRR